MLALVVSVAGSSAADGVAAARGGDSLLIRGLAGRSVNRATLSEPAGIIREFRVAAPAGSRLTVTAVIPGLAGVSASVPRTRFDSAEVCSRRGGTVVCVQGEEACPMPAANWHFLVRKLSGPAGTIGIDFVIGPGRSR